MPRTRIILGYPTASKASAPFLVYCGPSGSEAETAQRANSTAHRFEIFEGPGRFKTNSRFDPSAVAPVAVAPAPFIPPVPDEIKGMKKEDLIKALGHALHQNQQLQEALTQAAKAQEAPAEEPPAEEPPAEESPPAE